MCGNNHVGECVFGTNNCYGCGKTGHMVRYCPNVRIQGKGNSHAQSSGRNSQAQKKVTVSMHLRQGVNKKDLPMF